MGIYIQPVDLVEEFGATNITAWSDLLGTGSGSNIAARKAAAIAYAESRIHGRLRGARYRIPLSSAGDSLPMIQRWCRVLAGAWLYQGRGLRDDATTTKLEALVELVEEDLDQVLSRQMELDCTLEYSGPTVPVIPR